VTGRQGSRRRLEAPPQEIAITAIVAVMTDEMVDASHEWTQSSDRYLGGIRMPPSTRITSAFM
jgi:hypothetical protein